MLCDTGYLRVKVADAESAVNNVDDYAESARLIASTTLRNVLGTKTLGSILSESETIAREIKEELDLATQPWGVLVERVEVKDVSVPEQLQRSLASEAEAVREARAKVRLSMTFIVFVSQVVCPCVHNINNVFKR